MPASLLWVPPPAIFLLLLVLCLLLFLALFLFVLLLFLFVLLLLLFLLLLLPLLLVFAFLVLFLVLLALLLLSLLLLLIVLSFYYTDSGFSEVKKAPVDASVREALRALRAASLSELPGESLQWFFWGKYEDEMVYYSIVWYVMVL